MLTRIARPHNALRQGSGQRPRHSESVDRVASGDLRRQGERVIFRADQSRSSSKTQIASRAGYGLGQLLGRLLSTGRLLKLVELRQRLQGGHRIQVQRRELLL